MTTLNADSSFHIGNTHSVCEDYAFANVDRERNTAVAVVSDGCSSSKDTDFGARFLARSAAEHITFASDTSTLLRVIHTAAAMAKQVGLKEEALDATVLCISAHEDLCSVHVHGDGAIAAIRRDGTVEVRNYEYPSNMPFYLSYCLNNDRLRKYAACSKQAEHIITNYTNWAEADKQTGYYIPKLPGYLMFSSRLYSSVFVMSDGVHSFQRKTEEGRIKPVDSLEVIKQLIAVKTYGGVFVKRCCKKFLNSFCADNGWAHYDDLSVAAVHFG